MKSERDAHSEVVEVALGRAASPPVVVVDGGALGPGGGGSLASCISVMAE